MRTKPPKPLTRADRQKAVDLAELSSRLKAAGHPGASEYLDNPTFRAIVAAARADGIRPRDAYVARSVAAVLAEGKEN